MKENLATNPSFMATTPKKASMTQSTLHGAATSGGAIGTQRTIVSINR